MFNHKFNFYKLYKITIMLKTKLNLQTFKVVMHNAGRNADHFICINDKYIIIITILHIRSRTIATQ